MDASAIPHSPFPIPGVTDAMLAGWLQLYFWPFLRIGALLLAAPVLGGRTLSPRIRLMFALVLTALMAPLLPALPAMGLFSTPWWLAMVHETVIGLGLGLALQLVFEAAMLAGELVSYGMGLGFAQLADPIHGAAAPMIGQFYQLCAMLLFLVLGGLPQLAQLLVDSFRLAPVNGNAPNAHAFADLARFGGLCFEGSLRIALPAVTALLLVNLGFGVMNRSAPALNAMSIGFPLSVLFGMVVLCYSLPQLQTVLSELLTEAWGFAGQWLRGVG